jgi:hypothetical protein
MPRSEERESKFKILTLLRIIMDFLKKTKGKPFFFHENDLAFYIC